MPSVLHELFNKKGTRLSKFIYSRVIKAKECSVLEGFTHGLNGQLMHLDVGRRGQDIHNGIGHILSPQHGQRFVGLRHHLSVHQAGTDAL